MNPSALSLLTGPIKGTEMSAAMEIMIFLTVLSLGPLVLDTQSLIFTKSDECRYFGPLVNAALAAALPVSYLSLGENPTGDLVVARPQVFASLLLTGVATDD